MQDQVATYDPAIFNVRDLAEARNVILTEDVGLSTDERWSRETPYLVDQMAALDLAEESVVLDYGCGIGRLSRGLIERYGCRVVGVDISPNMRAFAAHYVGSDRFFACHPSMLPVLGIQFDAALSVWVLQHTLRPDDEISRIYGSLKQGGKLFVVNETARFVPIGGDGWIDDKIDVRFLLKRRFLTVSEGRIAPGIVSPETSARTYCVLFQK